MVLLNQDTKSENIIICRENIEAIIAHYQIPVGDVTATLSDRCFFQCRSDTLPYIRHLCKLEKFSPWDINVLHGATARIGWRELVPKFSCQIVYHTSNQVEFDFDIWNPDWDLVRTLAHLFGEVLTPGKTDPRKVRNGLIKRGVIRKGGIE